MKSRLYVVAGAACSAIALGTPVAQAHLQGNWSYAAAVNSTSGLKSTSSQSTLGAMRAAGTDYHASARKAQQTRVRPDDRSGLRGI
jgi:hypothetical protein